MQKHIFRLTEEQFKNLHKHSLFLGGKFREETRFYIETPTNDIQNKDSELFIRNINGRTDINLCISQRYIGDGVTPECTPFIADVGDKVLIPSKEIADYFSHLYIPADNLEIRGVLQRITISSPKNTVLELVAEKLTHKRGYLYTLQYVMLEHILTQQSLHRFMQSLNIPFERVTFKSGYQAIEELEKL